MIRPRYPRVFKASTDVPIEVIGEWALSHKADHVLMVVAGGMDGHKGTRYRRACSSAASILGDDLLERFEADAWPVTQLFGSTSTVFAGRFSERVLRRMVEAEPLLAKWIYPKPEDVCFFRAGAAMPRFASTTHEKDAYYFARTAPDSSRRPNWMTVSARQCPSVVTSAAFPNRDRNATRLGRAAVINRTRPRSLGKTGATCCISPCE